MEKDYKISFTNTFDLGKQWYGKNPVYSLIIPAVVSELDVVKNEEGAEDIAALFVPTVITLKNRYVLSTNLVPAYVVDAFTRLKFYDRVLIESDSMAYVASEIEIEAEWQFDEKAFALVRVIFTPKEMYQKLIPTGVVDPIAEMTDLYMAYVASVGGVADYNTIYDLYVELLTDVNYGNLVDCYDARAGKIAASGYTDEYNQFISLIAPYRHGVATGRIGVVNDFFHPITITFFTAQNAHLQPVLSELEVGFETIGQTFASSIGANIYMCVWYSKNVASTSGFGAAHRILSATALYAYHTSWQNTAHVISLGNSNQNAPFKMFSRVSYNEMKHSRLINDTNYTEIPITAGNTPPELGGTSLAGRLYVFNGTTTPIRIRAYKAYKF